MKGFQEAQLLTLEREGSLDRKVRRALLGGGGGGFPPVLGIEAGPHPC